MDQTKQWVNLSEPDLNHKFNDLQLIFYLQFICYIIIFSHDLFAKSIQIYFNINLIVFWQFFFAK